MNKNTLLNLPAAGRRLPGGLALRLTRGCLVKKYAKLKQLIKERQMSEIKTLRQFLPTVLHLSKQEKQKAFRTWFESLDGEEQEAVKEEARQFVETITEVFKPIRRAISAAINQYTTQFNQQIEENPVLRRQLIELEAAIQRSKESF